MSALDEGDRMAIQRILDADDKLGAAHQEVARLSALALVLESRIRGLQNEKREAERLARRWRATAEAR